MDVEDSEAHSWNMGFCLYVRQRNRTFSWPLSTSSRSSNRVVVQFEVHVGELGNSLKTVKSLSN